MATVVSICNSALSLVGDRATLTSIDPPEGSAQADHCATFWPMARDEALSQYDWRFCSTVQPLAALSDSLQDNPGWEYAYALPADYLVARDFVWQGQTYPFDDCPIQYELGTISNGTQVLFANHTDISLRYTRRVYDPGKYPAKLVTALGYLLGSYLAGPIVKGRAGVALSIAQRQMWDKLGAEAAVIDANQQQRKSAFKPAGLRARGYSAPSDIYEDGQLRRELPYWAA